MCKMSPSINNLAVAMVQFNAKVGVITKDATNPFFKNEYATLDNIINVVRPLLAAEGLALMQFMGGDGENVTVKNMLIHESGEWLESDPLIMRPAKNDPQGVGSCSTYARRYSLSSFLSLNTERDDDGNQATHARNHPEEPIDENLKAIQDASKEMTKGKPSGKLPSTPACSENQSKMLYHKHKSSTLEGFDVISDFLGYVISRTNEVRASDVNKLIVFLDERKSG